jgi:hypothetical protein
MRWKQDEDRVFFETDPNDPWAVLPERELSNPPRPRPEKIDISSANAIGGVLPKTSITTRIEGLEKALNTQLKMIIELRRELDIVSGELGSLSRQEAGFQEILGPCERARALEAEIQGKNAESHEANVYYLQLRRRGD